MTSHSCVSGVSAGLVAWRQRSRTGEWKADVQWIPFDLPSAVEIETAFQAGKGEARLTCGFFEDKRAARACPAGPTHTSADQPCCAQRAT